MSENQIDSNSTDSDNIFDYEIGEDKIQDKHNIIFNIIDSRKIHNCN